MGLGNWLVKKISRFLVETRPSAPSYLCDFDRICHEVRPADVLLVEGKSPISHVIQRVTHSPWTHAVLYIGRLHNIEDPRLREEIHRHYKGPPGEQLIIESIVGKGTVVNSIKDYKNDHIRVCRPSGLSYQDTQRVIAYAINTVGREYNVRHFFDLGRFLVGGKLIPRRWQSSLFKHKAGQATEDICSAMLATAFTSINFPILPLVRKKDGSRTIEMIHRNPKLYTPSDFDYSPYFDIIKYPMFSLTEVVSYRQLPWREGMLSNDDHGVSEHPVDE